MFRRYPIEKPWRNEFNKFSVVKPNWHVINKEEKIVLEDKDTRPLLVDCRFNRSGEPEEDEKKFQYREYRILTYGHWLSCPIGQTLPFFKSKSDVFPSRLIDAATLPRVNRKTFEMFEEDVLIKERKGIFDE